MRLSALALFIFFVSLSGVKARAYFGYGSHLPQVGMQLGFNFGLGVSSPLMPFATCGMMMGMTQACQQSPWGYNPYYQYPYVGMYSPWLGVPYCGYSRFSPLGYLRCQPMPYCGRSDCVKSKPRKKRDRDDDDDIDVGPPPGRPVVAQPPPPVEAPPKPEPPPVPTLGMEPVNGLPPGFQPVVLEPPPPPPDPQDRCEDYSAAYRKPATESSTACPDGKCVPGQAQQPSHRNLTAKVSSPLVQGMHKLMATLYQSCLPLEERNLVCGSDKLEGYTPGGKDTPRRIEPNGGLEKILGSHFYLKQITGGRRDYCKNLPRQCPRNICERPPLFRFGGHLVLDSKTNTLKTSDYPDPKIDGLDCADAIAAGVLASGNLLVPGAANRGKNWTTKDFLSFGKTGTAYANACLAPPTFGRNRTLIPGDVVVWNETKIVDGKRVDAGHTFMVESVNSTDPFGLEKAFKAYTDSKRVARTSLKPEVCDSSDFTQGVDFKNLGFTLVQSSAFDNEGFGLMRIRAKDYFSEPRMSDASAFLLRLVQKACRAELGSPALAAIDNEGARKLAVLRHARAENPSARPECAANSRMPTPKIEGEECIRSCL